MPGIFGFITKRENIGEDSLLRKMASVVSHYPQYQHDNYTDKDIYLHINGISKDTAFHKVSYRGSEYIVGIDGYIYFIPDLIKNNDWEDQQKVAQNLVQYVENANSEDLKNIEGNYTVIIYSKKAKVCKIFNDRMGPRRFYYADLKEGFFFGSEVKSISQLECFQKKINWKAISDLLNIGYILGTDTLFDSIHSLRSSSCIIYNKEQHQFKITKYWNPRYTQSITGLDEATEQCHPLLRMSIQNKIKENDSIISPISGGLDSRIILAHLNDIQEEKNFNILPITYAQKFSNEYIYAKKVCQKLNIEHNKLINITGSELVPLYENAVWLSEGHIPIGNAHLLLINRSIDAFNGVLFNGIYGGPTNYNSDYYRLDHLERQFELEQKIKDIQKVICINPEIFDQLIHSKKLMDMAKYGYDSIKMEFGNHIDASDEFCNQRDAFFIENRMRRAINQSSLYRYQWEEHLPLSSYGLYEYYLTLDPVLRLKRVVLKEMLKQKYTSLAMIKNANTGMNLFQKESRIGQQIKEYNRRIKYYLYKYSKGKISFYDKSNYAHFNIWFQKDQQTREFFSKKLASKYLMDLGIFSERKLNEFGEQVQNGAVGLDHLVRIVTLSIWAEKYIFGCNAKIT